jgi:hypothetical protein
LARIPGSCCWGRCCSPCRALSTCRPAVNPGTSRSRRGPRFPPVEGPLRAG